MSYSKNIESNLLYGFMFPHHNESRFLNEKNVSGFEINLSKRMMGDEGWHQKFNYPHKGISLIYFNLSSKQYLGYGLGVIPYVGFIHGRRNNLQTKIGFGLGYVQKPYHHESNSKNVVIGSSLNMMFRLGTSYYIKISERLSFKTGFNLFHYSNGAFKMPNLGINNLVLDLGVSYKLGANSLLHKQEEVIELRNWEFFLFSNFGLKEIRKLEKNKHIIFGIVADGNKFVSKKVIVGVGVDLYYNSSLANVLELENSGYVFNRTDNLRLGIHGSIGTKLGRNYFLFQTGVYLKNSLKNDGILYSKLVNRYAITDKFFASFSLKSHLEVADFFELGIGIKL